MGLQELVASASNMAFMAIGNLSQSLILRRETQGQYDPISGRFTAGMKQDYPCKGVILTYSARETGIYAMAGTMIQVDDRKCLLDPASLGICPELTDTIITCGGVSYSILSIKDTRPNTQVFLYELRIRAV